MKRRLTSGLAALTAMADLTATAPPVTRAKVNPDPVTGEETSRNIERRRLFDQFFERLPFNAVGHSPRSERRKLARARAAGIWRASAKPGTPRRANG